jgi:aerobic carbon-monoxide dehydrogenase medium subunit
MKPAPFAYIDPRSLDEAVEALREHGDDAKVLAGGQSLVPMLNLRLARPAFVVDINGISGLDGAADHGNVLRLGALVRQRWLERWATRRAPLIAAALRLVGHAAIRNRGTVAGSVSHADPAAELPALFLALDGIAVARSADGDRTIPAGELFLGPLTTSLRSDEIVVETRWTLPPAGSGWGFHEVARRHGDFALVGCAAVVTWARERVESARIALFGAGPTPVRAQAAETALAGVAPTSERISDAARLAAEGVAPDSDIHASAGYRQRVTRVLVERALRDAVARVPEAPP